MRSVFFLPLLALLFVAPVAAQSGKYDRDPAQSVDQEYTRKIKEYTTRPEFNSPLTDYLPASASIPTPRVVLGDVAGAPNILPYTAEVNKYFRLLEKASPRVKVFSIGTSEEGREMIAVAVSSEANLAKLDANRANLAKLADPRLIGMNDGEAGRIADVSVPIYYLTGTIHSTETGAPTALMELGYRLAVDDSAYIRSIRDNVITLITPVVETDGRDRMVDIYRWHVAHPDQLYPPLLYWGHYVAHDNNRDSMGLSLKLTRNVLRTYVDWRAQVLHDLHESVPYLYDNTVGDEPYNAWLDPILTNEWQIIGWNNVSEMTKFGMPGVYAHGNFDTWSPSYLMFIAATHNGISRLYETFGNAGADTLQRTLSQDETERTWYRQNPPLPRAMWSQRNNNNYQQTGILVSLAHFAENRRMFLYNFYLKSRRSIEKPKNEGPAAYVFPADDPRPGAQAELLRLMQAQGCEISRATEPFTATIGKKKPASESASGSNEPAAKPETRQFPAGSYVLRMDQPYSRIADMMLDYQYWSTNDRQTAYDDTAWTFGELNNVSVVRITDAAVLNAAMERVNGDVKAPSSVTGTGKVFLVNNNTDNALITLRYRLRSANFQVSEEPFEAAGAKFARGSFIISGADRAEVERTVKDLELRATAVEAAPKVASHPIKAARIAVMHTWLNTQDEGWWRIALDQMGVPYTYISTQDAAATKDLNAKYDVIIFAPTGGHSAQTIIAGIPMNGNPMPWKTTPETPNLGTFTSTDDIRPGLGLTGVTNLQNFVRKGGLLITSMNTSEFAVNLGMTQGVTISRQQRLKAPGTIVRAKLVDGTSPIAYGYAENLSVFYAEGPIFNLSNMAGGRSGRPGSGDERRTGRGTADDPDIVQGRPNQDAPEIAEAETWEAQPLTSEQLRNNYYVIPAAQRPRVVFRFSGNRDLLVSGLLGGGGEVAEHAAVIDVPLDQGHIVLFSNNPFWRGETQGSYFLAFNAILNFDNLNAGRSLR